MIIRKSRSSPLNYSGSSSYISDLFPWFKKYGNLIMHLLLFLLISKNQAPGLEEIGGSVFAGVWVIWERMPDPWLWFDNRAYRHTSQPWVPNRTVYKGWTLTWGHEIVNTQGTLIHLLYQPWRGLRKINRNYIGLAVPWKVSPKKKKRILKM